MIKNPMIGHDSTFRLALIKIISYTQGLIRKRCMEKWRCGLDIIETSTQRRNNANDIVRKIYSNEYNTL